MEIAACPNTEDADGDSWTVWAGDCDDIDDAINPSATETCDGVDQDCDGDIDEGLADCDTTDTGGSDSGEGEDLTAATFCDDPSYDWCTVFVAESDIDPWFDIATIWANDSTTVVSLNEAVFPDWGPVMQITDAHSDDAWEADGQCRELSGEVVFVPGEDYQFTVVVAADEAADIGLIWMDNDEAGTVVDLTPATGVGVFGSFTVGTDLAIYTVESEAVAEDQAVCLGIGATETTWVGGLAIKAAP